jgi:hypothetical protein
MRMYSGFMGHKMGYCYCLLAASKTGCLACNLSASLGVFSSVALCVPYFKNDVI